MYPSLEAAIEGRWREEDRGFTTPCWIWRGHTTNGYGQLGALRQTHYAHRASYEVHVGPIPKGKHLHHLCHVRLCIRPDHLEAIARDEHSGANGHGKLTIEQVGEIKALLGTEHWSHYQIAALYDISPSLVCMIGRGQRWRRIPVGPLPY